MNIHQWKNQVKSFNDSFTKNTEIRKQWAENTKANFPKFKKEQSIWELDFLFYKTEKICILVGSSPRLKKDVKKLRNLDDRFCIICVNSSLKYLLEHDVVPDYCLAIDSDHIDIPQHLDIDRDDVTLLASTVICPSVLDTWKGPIYFVPYYSVEKKWKKKVRAILGKGVPSGGNSMTEAMYIASIIFNSRTIIFVGNELCFDTVKDYYADSKSAKQEKMLVRYPIKDILRRDRWTQPAHWIYAQWTEKIAADLSPPGYFIDTSFGILGMQKNSVIHIMELNEAIEKVSKAYNDAQRLNNAKTEEERAKILKELTSEHEQSDVYRYNMHAQREKLLQLARS